MTSLACPGCRGPLKTLHPRAYGTSSLMQCTECATECLHPQPDDARLADIYSDSYYDPWASESDPTVEPMKRGTFSWLLGLHPLRPGSRVLDLGCATGFFLRLAAERGYEVSGIDINPFAIERCRETVPDAQLHAGVLGDGPFGETAFDAVFMVDFIEHVRDPEHEIRVVASRLAQGGVAVISTPRTDSLLRRVMGGGWIQYKEEHLTYFSLRGLTRLLEQCGLRVVLARPTRKTLTLGYVHRLLQVYRHPLLTPAFALVWRLLPLLRDVRFPIRLGEMTVVARRNASASGDESAG